MTIIILQIVVGVLGLSAMWYKDYQSAGEKAKREKEDANAAIEKDREAIVAGDTDAVTQRIDSVLRAEGYGYAGESSGTDKAGSSSINGRLAHFNISTEHDT